ncbi:MAG: shikimate kinase [Candidatus Omnitrophica bacterium]|nr:shikimate kinase [Candidatus Omnitrophota bacterium]
MSNIYLVGFMGTGKTIVGKLLSHRLKKQFIEMDEFIEQREKMSILKIFSQRGEGYFRKVEKEVLKEIANKNDCVVSCGGGVVIDNENMEILKRTGLVICLSADSETIYERTAKDKNRPLLNVDNPKKRIEELLKIREPFYRKSHIFIDTTNISPEEVVDKIVKVLNG